MKLKVTENNIRLDQYLSENTDYSRSQIKKLLIEGHILVNNKLEKAGYKIKIDDEIEIKEIKEEIKDAKENIPLDIVYEDDYLAIINKQSGLVVHPAVGNLNHTLVNALLYHFSKLSNDQIRPGIVHRLDKDTSGLMIVCKDDKTHELISDMLKNKKIERHYIALVWGDIKCEKGTIDAPIGRDINNRQKYCVTDINSKDAITHFKVLKRYKKATLIECVLETGRTHQIRVHLNYIGNPLVNDLVYGNRKIISKDFGQMLHSKSIRFNHPILNKEIYLEKEPPQEFLDILKLFENDTI